MHFLINGKSFDFEPDVRLSLLDLFREHLGLTGTKKGCNQGACGACTVLVDGERINSCLALAVQYQVGRSPRLRASPRPASCIHYSRPLSSTTGFQCGYCTPGQLCSAVGMADEVAARSTERSHDWIWRPTTIALDHDELRERMSGNLCRCGAYNGIVEAIAETFAKERA